MSRRILLPTLERPSAVGGIARHLDAMLTTFPEHIELLVIDEGMTRRQMFAELERAAKGCCAIWVHHVLPIGTMAWFLHALRGISYVIFLHGMDFDLARRNPWKRWLTRRILRGAKRIVTNSKALAREVQAFAKTRGPMVVYPSVSDELVHASHAVARRFPRTDRLTLLTVARLVKRKGHLEVLKAMRRLPDVHYVIVGDGPRRERIAWWVRHFGLQDRVEMLGRISDERLIEVYRSADLFVMPTSSDRCDREGFGTVYLEAQLFGLPVIATRQPGVDEALLDRVSGFLIEDRPDLLEDFIERFLLEPELRARMGEAGREFVLANFTREKQMARLAGLVLE